MKENDKGRATAYSIASIKMVGLVYTTGREKRLKKVAERLVRRKYNLMTIRWLPKQAI